MSEKRLIPADEWRLPPTDAACESSLEAVRANAECQAIAEALREAGQNVSVAAARLGITRSTIYRRIRKYGLRVGRADRREP